MIGRVVLLTVGVLLSGAISPLALPDEGTFVWEPRASLPTARGGFGSAVLGGKVYVAGGLIGQWGDDVVTAAFEMYDPATDNWTVLPPLPTPRWGLVLAALSDRLVAAGGSIQPFACCGVTNLTEIYVPSLGQWVTGTPMPEPRIFSAGFSHSGRVHVIGGSRDGTSSTNTQWSYATDWTVEGSLPVAVQNAAAVPLLSRIHLTGGWPNEPTHFALNGSTGQWEFKTGMLKGRGAHATAALNDRVYVVGGVTADTTECLPSRSVEAYDYTTDTWSQRPDFPVAYWGLGAATIGRILYAYGGGRCDESSSRMFAIVSSIPSDGDGDGNGPPFYGMLVAAVTVAAVSVVIAAVVVLRRRRRRRVPPRTE